MKNEKKVNLKGKNVLVAEGRYTGHVGYIVEQHGEKVVVFMDKFGKKTFHVDELVISAQ